ncbi:hypothetical protein HHI36_014862 [Cryptolaemus montrouzieri]|uniref:Uncharacterized protein n=1 Tax=Cryptolaemus montrouzieri TaxID=559131 RepID=A0ABD2N4Q8_9CUCU
MSNVVIYGLNLSQQEQFEVEVVDEFNQLLGLRLCTNDLNNAFVNGKGLNRPIKLESVSYLKKGELLKLAFKLKGNEVFINNDLTPEEQKQNKLLRDHLKKARPEGYLAHIKKNFLLKKINLEEGENLPSAISGAPSTPTILETDLAGAVEDEVFSEQNKVKENAVKNLATGRTLEVEPKRTLRHNSERKKSHPQ